jgi:hypothetical protein
MNSDERNIVLPQKDIYCLPEYTKKRLIGKVQGLNYIRVILVMGLVQPSRDVWCLRLLRPPSPFNSLRSFYFCSSFCILRTHIGIEELSHHTTTSKRKKKTITKIIPKGLKTILAEKNHLPILPKGKLPIGKYTPKYANSLNYLPKESNKPPFCLARILANHKTFVTKNQLSKSFN